MRRAVRALQVFLVSLVGVTSCGGSGPSAGRADTNADGLPFATDEAGASGPDASPACVHNGHPRRAGEVFDAGDGCNTCTCLESGETVCTERVCLADAGAWDGGDTVSDAVTASDIAFPLTDTPASTECEFEGETYRPGETFARGCKTCHCMGDGSVACTLDPCADTVGAADSGADSFGDGGEGQSDTRNYDAADTGGAGDRDAGEGDDAVGDAVSFGDGGEGQSDTRNYDAADTGGAGDRDAGEGDDAVGDDVSEVVEPRVYEGSYTVRATEHVEFIYPYTEITGMLTIRTVRADIMRLPNLRRVGDALFIQENNLTHLELPRLQEIGSSLYVQDNPGLRTLDVANVRSAGAVMLDGSNPDLQAIDLPLVGHLHHLNLQPHEALERVDLSALSEVEVDFVGKGLPLDFRMAGLRRVGNNLALLDCPAWTEVTLGSLEETGGDLAVYIHEGVTRVSAPLLVRVGGAFNVSSNPALEEIVFSSLEWVGGEFTVWYNPLLPQCLVEDLYSRIEVVGLITTGDNREDCTCSGDPSEAVCGR